MLSWESAGNVLVAPPALSANREFTSAGRSSEPTSRDALAGGPWCSTRSMKRHRRSIAGNAVHVWIVGVAKSSAHVWSGPIWCPQRPSLDLTTWTAIYPSSREPPTRKTILGASNNSQFSITVLLHENRRMTPLRQWVGRSRPECCPHPQNSTEPCRRLPARKAHMPCPGDSQEGRSPR